jgi:acyl carrier protein
MMSQNQKPIRIEDIQKFLAEQFNVPIKDIPLDLSFGDFPQWDSLGHMSLMAAIEDKFGVAIDADAIAELTSVKNIHSFLDKKSNG